MKKIVLAMLAMIGTSTMQAADYPYLTFELTDGTKASVSVESLTLTISGSTLTAGSQTFELTNLSKMYFSTTAETVVTGIKSFDADNSDDIIEVYDLNGRKIAKDQMRKGIYVVKTTSGTYKVNVK